ncbi:MAG: DUF2075 domain-containing protein [Saccharofermentanales bacterium]|jgi:DUF2075 family protein
MILYHAELGEFKDDVDSNRIVSRILDKFQCHLGYSPGMSERQSWASSLRFMESAVRRAELPNDCGVMIEFKLPTTSRRIDFLIAGKDLEGRDNYVLVELKQWSEARKSTTPRLVNTFIGGAQRDVSHPSHQAMSYNTFLSEINEEIYTRNIIGNVCAYLHNYRQKNPEPLLDEQYGDFIREAPLFFQEDTAELQAYLKKFLSQGNGMNICYFIENGRLKPSKKLIENVTSLFNGNDAFTLIDDQAVAFEKIAHQCSLRSQQKNVIIVEGGPGTGKSVVSMNVFGKLLSQGKNVKFVAPNAAFRKVLVEKLYQDRAGKKAYLEHLVSGSLSFYDVPRDLYDVLIVDEAHRLKDRTAYMYRGENQVEDIINAAKVSVFFIDDGQQIRREDLGSVSSINDAAIRYGAHVTHMTLSAQFRCSGAEGYVNWITDVLQLERTGNEEGWDEGDFDFRIFDTPQQVYEIISQHQLNGSDARILAGYAWPWTTQGNSDAQVRDVRIDEYDFAMPWNSRANSSLWAINPEGKEQIGCIHTSQGLEFDYVGVLFGNDITFDPTTGEVKGVYEEYYDRTGKSGLRNNSEELTLYIKSIYKILCSRGMKGCYIFVRDKNLKQYMSQRLSAAKNRQYEIDLSQDSYLRVAESNDNNLF